MVESLVFCAACVATLYTLALFKAWRDGNGPFDP